MPEEVQATEVAQAPAEAPAAPAAEPKQEAAPPTDGQQAEQTTEPESKPEERERDERGRFKGAQARIDELTRAKHEALREAAYWRELAAKGQAPQQAEQKPKPTPDQFQDYAQYVEALTEWKAEDMLAKTLSKRDAQQAQTAEQRAAQARAQTFAERAQVAKAAMPDFDDVVGRADVPIADHVRDVILDSDAGPQLAYHLAKNPDVAQRISAMEPLAAARELGRLEASLAAPRVPTRTVSNAPPPARGIPGNAPSPTRDPSRMSMDEYAAWRKSQGASWAR